MAVRDGNRISAAIFKTLPGMLSGPVALLEFTALRQWRSQGLNFGEGGRAPTFLWHLMHVRAPYEMRE